MLHLSRSTFLGMVDESGWRIPATLHVTYCRQTAIPAEEIGTEETVDCDECIQALLWEQIDKR